MAKNLEPVRVALIGCGAVSQLYYAPALKELIDLGILSVKAVYDPDNRRAAKLRSLLPSARAVKGTAILSTHNIELAIVASPNCHHLPQTLELLESGISVLCEKPLAVSYDQAQAMVERAEKVRKLLAVGLFRRFFPALNLIHKLVESNLLGKAMDFRFAEGGPFAWDLQSSSLFDQTQAGGGILIDIGVHALDMMEWWFGEPSSIHYEDDAMGGVEANCAIITKFHSGLTGSIRLSRDLPLSNRYEIEFEKGSVSWTTGSASEIQTSLKGTDFNLVSSVQELQSSFFNGKSLSSQPFTYHHSLMAQLLNVCAAVRGNESLVVPGSSALANMKLIDYCYKNRKLMPMPWLTETELATASSIRQKQIC